MSSDDEIHLGGYRLSELVRRARRTADFSQRELAKHAGVSPGTIAAIESAARVPSLALLDRVLNAANCQLVVVDGGGRYVLPLLVWEGVTDGAGRRYPAHLDTVIDPEYGEWWADVYGLARPPETFHRDRAVRDFQRARSQWEVRVAKYRHDPPPQPPAQRRLYWPGPGPGATRRGRTAQKDSA
jgi:transcriptional regulator with XRE-family HTH domain